MSSYPSDSRSPAPHFSFGGRARIRENRGLGGAANSPMIAHVSHFVRNLIAWIVWGLMIGFAVWFLAVGITFVWDCRWDKDGVGMYLFRTMRVYGIRTASITRVVALPRWQGVLAAATFRARAAVNRLLESKHVRIEQVSGLPTIVSPRDADEFVQEWIRRKDVVNHTGLPRPT